MLGAIGDLVEDVVVRLLEPINVASDTRVHVQRRRGGSAANVVAAACRNGRAARFIGQVGDDPAATWLVDDLRRLGADVIAPRAGRTGSIIVLLDPSGERTMLSDRGACTDLADPDEHWLDGLRTLHLPLYSLVGEPLATTSATLVGQAHERGLNVSIDTSSASIIEHLGIETTLDLIRSLRPTVVLANELEASLFDGTLVPERVDARCVVVKQGPDPALVYIGSAEPERVDALTLDVVRDTTGAGDAFAAGFLCALADGAGPIEAAHAGHRSSYDTLRRLWATEPGT